MKINLVLDVKILFKFTAKWNALLLDFDAEKLIFKS